MKRSVSAIYIFSVKFHIFRIQREFRSNRLRCSLCYLYQFIWNAGYWKSFFFRTAQYSSCLTNHFKWYVFCEGSSIDNFLNIVLANEFVPFNIHIQHLRQFWSGQFQIKIVSCVHTWSSSPCPRPYQDERNKIRHEITNELHKKKPVPIRINLIQKCKWQNKNPIKQRKEKQNKKYLNKMPQMRSLLSPYEWSIRCSVGSQQTFKDLHVHQCHLYRSASTNPQHNG